MLSNYANIRDAIREIEESFDKEITKWYRIRRQAIRRGHFDLAQEILEEIEKAKNQVHTFDLWSWPFGYQFLFQLDRPASYYR